MVAGGSSCTCPSCGTVCTGRFEACAHVWEKGPQEVRLLAAPASVWAAARAPGMVGEDTASHGANGNGSARNGTGPEQSNGRPLAIGPPGRSEWAAHGPVPQGHGALPIHQAVHNPDAAPHNGALPGSGDLRRNETLPGDGTATSNGSAIRNGSELAGCLAEMRALQDRIEQAQQFQSGAGDDEAGRMADAILREFDAMPGRIAAAMSAALRQQHRAIMLDVQSALRDALIEFRDRR